jgi:hypothetical protein
MGQAQVAVAVIGMVELHLIAQHERLPAPAARGDAPDRLRKIGLPRPPVCRGFAAVLPLATHTTMLVDLSAILCDTVVMNAKLPVLTEDSGPHGWVTEWFCDPPAEGARYRVLREEWQDSDEKPVRSIYEVAVDVTLPPLRPPDKRSRQRALMHQASIVAGELRIILEQLEALMDEEG